MDSLDAEESLASVRDYFVEGLIWNLRYYYQGCCSWEWFYPYYYAPFPSDLKNISHLQNMQFNMGEPFECLEQLMAVLPPYSSKALPQCFKQLMFDDDSEIIDFYPSEFAVDIKGKSFSWLGEVILPFINENRLKRALESRK